MKNFFPFVLVGIVILVKILPLILKANKQEQDGWKEEDPPPRPMGKKAVSGPDALTQIMQQFNQVQEQKATPPVLPARKRPPPEEVVPEVAEIKEAPSKRYLTAESMEASPTAKSQKADTEKQATLWRTSIGQQTSKVAGDALNAAFPGKKKRKTKFGKTNRAALRGRRNLRRAIILGEVLGPPRSFDI